MEGIIEERFDLNPPIEAMPKSTGAQMKSVHEARLAECEKIRADYEEGFVKEDKDSSDRGIAILSMQEETDRSLKNQTDD